MTFHSLKFSILLKRCLGKEKWRKMVGKCYGGLKELCPISLNHNSSPLQYNHVRALPPLHPSVSVVTVTIRTDKRIFLLWCLCWLPLISSFKCCFLGSVPTLTQEPHTIFACQNVTIFGLLLFKWNHPVYLIFKEVKYLRVCIHLHMALPRFPSLETLILNINFNGTAIFSRSMATAYYIEQKCCNL